MVDKTLGILATTLLAKDTVDIDAEALHEQLKANCGRVEIMSVEPNGFHFAYLDYPAHYKDGSIPAQSFISSQAIKAPPEGFETALQQSWGLGDDMREVVVESRHSVMVTDLMAGGLERHKRVTLFHKVLLSLVTMVNCDALYWQNGQQFTPVDAYLDSQAEPNPNLLYGLYNVRMFNISNGAPGEVLMDTMGLATLGLPDIQCHFTQLDPNKIAAVLFNTGAYLFEKGDVIEDGHTVQGIEPDHRWVCQQEDALVGPERAVLDINPGHPYAAGSRGT